MVKGSLVLLDDTFPHGTVAGYDRGCKGGHCPAAIACRDVKRRFGSDLDFRRLIDAGVPLEEIVAIDQAAAETDAALERRRRRGLPDEAPLTLDAADVAEARRPKPSPPALRPEDLVVPPEVALQADIEKAYEAAPEAVPAERPRKWAVRRVWMAIAPDGSVHGPFEGQQEGLTFVGAQFPMPVLKAPERVTEPLAEADSEEATPKRGPYQRWTPESEQAARSLWKRGLSDSDIARQLKRGQPSVSSKLRSLGLAANGRAGARPKTPTA